MYRPAEPVRASVSSRSVSPTAVIVYGRASWRRSTTTASPALRIVLSDVSRWPLTATASAPAAHSPLTTLCDVDVAHPARVLDRVVGADLVDRGVVQLDDDAVPDDRERRPSRTPSSSVASSRLAAPAPMAAACSASISCRSRALSSASRSATPVRRSTSASSTARSWACSGVAAQLRDPGAGHQAEHDPADDEAQGPPAQRRAGAGRLLGPVLRACAPRPRSPGRGAGA